MGRTTRRSSLLAALALACGLCNGVPAGAAPAADEAALLQRLDTIDAGLGALRTSTRPLQGIAPEGARITAYRRGARLVKIEADMLGERSRRRHEYYWHGGRLIAVRVRLGDADAQALPEDERMSFGGGGAVRAWWRAGAAGDPAGAAARERARQLRAEARSLRRFVALPEPQRACLWSCAQRAGAECLRYACE